MVLCGLFRLVEVRPSVSNPRGGHSSVRRTFAHVSDVRDPTSCVCPSNILNVRRHVSVRQLFDNDPSPCECVRLFVVRRVWYNVLEIQLLIYEFFRCRSIGPNTKSTTSTSRQSNQYQLPLLWAMNNESTDKRTTDTKVNSFQLKRLYVQVFLGNYLRR